MAISRTDTSTLGRWWWTVDRWTLAALLALIGCGYFMMLAASPAVAERLRATSREVFIFRQVFYLCVATGVLWLVSLLPPKGVLYLAALGCAGALVLTAATLVIGAEVKGARRWISLAGISLQPSEFLKPCFAVVVAFLLAGSGRAAARMVGSPWLARVWRQLPWVASAIGLFAVIALLLKSQPDIGMLLVLSAVFLAQFFVAGLPLVLVLAGAGLGIGGLFAAYWTMPHFRSRIDLFLYPPVSTGGGPTQLETALRAFGNGGLFGRGPGEGYMKSSLPDAHADMVFAVAGEEFGFVVCLIILLLFAFIVLRGLLRLLAESEPFVVLAAAGLLAQFGLQALINMCSSLGMIPTKGMTLPFVSYGGSSVVAIALGMGMLLALTRRRQHSRAQVMT